MNIPFSAKQPLVLNCRTNHHSTIGPFASTRAARPSRGQAGLNFRKTKGLFGPRGIQDAMKLEMTFLSIIIFNRFVSSILMSK